MQSESRRAAPQASQPPSKASARTFNSTTRRPRSGNPLQTSGSRTFFSFSCLLKADQEAFSRFAAFLFRSAKAAIVCSFHASGKNSHHLGCRNQCYAQERSRSAKQGNHLNHNVGLKVQRGKFRVRIPDLDRSNFKR